MKLPLFNQKGEKEQVEIKDSTLETKKLSDALLQYLYVFFSNKRQGTSKSKTRAEVRGGGRKPWRQKGTGRARHGSIRSPLWTGGGTSHGPSPKSWNKSFNKNTKKAVFKYVLSEALENNTVIVTDLSIDKPKTKDVLAYFRKTVEEFDNKKVLVVLSKQEDLYKSARNLSNVVCKNVDSLNTVDLLKADSIIFTAASFEILKNRLN